MLFYKLFFITGAEQHTLAQKADQEGNVSIYKFKAVNIIATFDHFTGLPSIGVEIEVSSTKLFYLIYI